MYIKVLELIKHISSIIAWFNLIFANIVKIWEDLHFE